MRLFVTGATGFLGRRVVQAALDRGHEVRAVARPAAVTREIAWASHRRAELVRLDLRSREGLPSPLAGMDTVIHLAAAKSGDLYTQLSSTVVATENLLAAMDDVAVNHIVGVSSFAVYDYLGKRSRSQLDESSPLEANPCERDEYCQAKLVQERMIREHASERGWTWTVLRPGVIFGEDNLWTSRLGMQLGKRWWLRIGAWAPLPLTSVENCAEAIVLSVESPAAAGRIFNVVDDELPRQRYYARLLQRRSSPRPTIIPLPWLAARAAARLAWLANRACLGGRARIPGVLVPARLHARCRPLRYSNASLKETTGWHPRYSLHEALDRSLAKGGPCRQPRQVPSVRPAAKAADAGVTSTAG